MIPSIARRRVVFPAPLGPQRATASPRLTSRFRSESAVIFLKRFVRPFTEIKKSVIGKNAKVSHLSYIGDADLGEEVNVGAGVITCNFDGKNKHKTVIGPKSFVGSNVNLIAPVKVGAGSILGAGSTITQDVPAHSLSLERAPQVIKKGWTKKKKGKKQ